MLLVTSPLLPYGVRRIGTDSAAPSVANAIRRFFHAYRFRVMPRRRRPSAGVNGFDHEFRNGVSSRW